MKPKYLKTEHLNGTHTQYLILIGFVISSCTKVINVDLNSVAPQIVVQANLPNQSGK